ncbi:MAG: PSD1 and planctomycete cytochrome C domain-containing protein [Pirellulales bacterium]
MASSKFRLLGGLLLVLLGGADRLVYAQVPTLPAATDPAHAAQMKAGLDLFQKEVRPVLIGRCVKCHGGDKTEGEFDLNTREALLKGGAEGVAVVAGKPTESRLLRLIRREEEPSMPEDGAPLPANQVAAIRRWIELGAPYDKPLIDKNVRPDAWIAATIEDQAREFWSFQPLRQVTPPQVEPAEWVTTDVDRFVLQALKAKGLTPNGPADRRHWIRRAYFDLLGLPPTPAEVTAFVQDEDPQAYRRLIDRLLENPHYGERWGRHWLDTARFAESHGFEQDYDRPHAYHYRDFVIQAFNQDLPFDEFVRWQIAGDEIAPDNPLALMATGFLGAGVFPTQLTEKEFEPARYDELDDMVSTLGTSMLGLTVGCARCHDHKYDPIPSGDYYRLVATFATAIRSNVELDLQPGETREQLRKWEDEHRPLTEELARWEADQLPARFDAWLARRVAEVKAGTTPADPAADPATHWLTLDLLSAVSKGGATLAPQDDGSWLASGKNPDFDTYTLVAQTYLTGIRALRLEALPDASLVKQGPGRAGNGNIGLGSIKVTAEPLTGAGKPVPVSLIRPRATFEQNSGGLSIAAALDSDPKTGWAVDPQFGKPQAAAFEFAEPVGFPGGTKFTVTLDFSVNNQHNIGRPRLGLTTAPSPLPLDAAPQSQRAAEILRLVDQSAGQLTPEQRTRVLQWYRTTDAEWRARNDKVAQHLAQRPQPQRTQVMIVSEGVKPIPHHADDRGFPHFYRETFYLKRGDVAQKQAAAPVGFLQLLMPAAPPSAAAEGTTSSTAITRWQVAPPAGAKTSFRRRALANWLTDTEQGAGQLLARVIVNRLWQHHFGRGIVATPNDFGRQGVRPTHPELLDYLASELIRGGWRLKPIQRLLMTSSVYRQSSELDEADAREDPENQWLWRFAPARLEAEIIRDNMLAVSGELDERMFGPGSLDEGHKRRSIYFMIKRSRLIPSMQLFDAPEPLVSVGGRPSTTIAPQALMFLNSPQVRGYARSFARRIAPAPSTALEETVRQGYLTALGRPPSAQELQDDVQFLERQSESYRQSGTAQPREAAVTDFCQVLLSLNEFVYIE